MLTRQRESLRLRRHARVRKKVTGSAQRPRLVVHRSHLHLRAQIVDDLSGKTLVACSTLEKEFRKSLPTGGTVEAAKRLGEFVAQAAKGKGVTKVVFDRGGHPYHGRVKALAEAARAKGLEM